MEKNEDSRLEKEDFEAWKEALGGKLEELGDQDTVEEALDKMRSGIWMHVYQYINDELHIVRQVDMPEGDVEEYVFIYALDKDSKMRLEYTHSLKWWAEQYIHYIGTKDLTLTMDAAMEKLKAGIPIVTPGYLYFTSQLHNDKIPELAGREFVFGMRRDAEFAESLYVADPIEKFHAFERKERYGYRKD